MSDRMGVSARHFGASAVASPGEPWRVAVGGNQVESMTIEQIAHAFHAGHLNVRTPLWPPGSSGWQALGNFDYFQQPPNPYEALANGQMPNGYGQLPHGHLSQFEEAEDDPTRMWTGVGDLELEGMAPVPPPPVASLPPARPSARTGPRQVSSRAPRPQSMQPPRMAAPVMPAPPVRQRRGNGLILVAGLVGLVGLGSAVLAARGSWSLASPTPEPAVTDPVAVAAAPVVAAPGTQLPEAQAAEPAPAGASEAAQAEANNQAKLAKYEDTAASAFVAGVEPSKVSGSAAEAGAEPATAATAGSADSPESAPAKAPEKARKEALTSAGTRQKAGSRTPVTKRATASLAPPAPRAKSKPEPTPEEEEEKAPPANSSVNEAAAAALATSASLASSCRPSGGPSGAGKARIIYSNDGDVQSVEILTAKFRDTLTGSCVRMVFRRAKIPPFKGEPPTFIKSFTIPEE